MALVAVALVVRLTEEDITLPCSAEADGHRAEVGIPTAEAASSAVASVVRRERGTDVTARAREALSGISTEETLSDEDLDALAAAFSGQAQDGAFSCEVDGDADGEPDRLDRSGLTARAATVLEDLEDAFGSQATGGYAPGGVSSGHQEGSAHYEGRAIDVFFRPINDANRTRGWSLAYYLVAHAERLKVEHVIFDDMIWSAGRSDEGWREYDPGDVSGASPETVAILEHRDHVHVDVYD